MVQHNAQELLQMNAALADANKKLQLGLQLAKDEIMALREEVEQLVAPANSSAFFIKANGDGTAYVLLGGQSLPLRVKVDAKTRLEDMCEGQVVLLNENLNIIGIPLWRPTAGTIAIVVNPHDTDDYRFIVDDGMDCERIVRLAGFVSKKDIKIGDRVLVAGDYVQEVLPRQEVQEVRLEEVPDVTYDDIGGLDEQIEQLRDAVELPYMAAQDFQYMHLKGPKGVLLYGPPGCGKTLIAKAVANSLARRIKERTGSDTTAYFLNIKGPELLNKYVGETEKSIRDVFRRARELASDENPVVIFFDEMDALFRARGSGISSDVETTTVAQLLTELDGLETLKNVIVIGASNRQDLIDPAVLRAGRLDYKIKVERPKKEGAVQIFLKYLQPDIPYDPRVVAMYGHKTVEHFARSVANAMYEKNDINAFHELTDRKGSKKTLYFSDFASGAMIENIVARAKKMAIKRKIAGGSLVLTIADLIEAVAGEYDENADLPNTAVPGDGVWSEFMDGEPIMQVKNLRRKMSKQQAKPVEDITPGQYL